MAPAPPEVRAHAGSVHGALLLSQLCWGSAAVVNKLGLSGVGVLPLLFALIREASAAPILLLLLRAAGKAKRDSITEEPRQCLTATEDCPSRSGRSASLALRLLPGLFVFLDQLCSLTGVSLADPVSAAAWQPSQVVFTVVISACLGMEALTPQKVLGASLTIAGGLCLVLLGGRSGAHHSEGQNWKIGQLFFLMNCLASSLEVIMWRRLLRDAEGPLAHFAVMAESYLVAACLMAVACMVVGSSSAATEFLCPECAGNAWHFPPKALWAVAYSVTFQTIVGYLSQAWALRYAEPSLAALYAAAQPVAAALVSCTLLAFGVNPGGALAWPGWEMTGAVLIVAGLCSTEYRSSDTRSEGTAPGAGAETVQTAGAAAAVPLADARS